MSRGIGTAQRALLELLDPESGASIKELATWLDRSPRQVRRAVTSLEQRGLVMTEQRRVANWRIARAYGGPDRNVYGRLVWLASAATGE